MYRCTIPRKRLGKHDLCKFSHRTCSLPALENYEYCIKHILEDKTAPFSTCGYVYPINGKKCNQPAPKLVDLIEGGFCAEHTRKAQVMRQRAGGRHCPPQTVESLLTSLSHYATSNASAGVINDMETDSDSHSHAINPFVELDASKVNLCGSRVLDYVSESDSDVEPATLESVWRDNDRDSSDAESVDSQQEDPLKHAGTFTAEEAALIVKEKMFRLQSLYYDQFKRLQHVLKERKRRYYHAFSKEKEAISKNNMTTIHEQSKSSAKELKLYEKLKALNQFHKRSGEEGILHMRVKEKRNQAKKMKKFKNKSRISDGKNEGLSINPAPTCKCIYTEGGVKCGIKTLPSSKYCRKHILEVSGSITPVDTFDTKAINARMYVGFSQSNTHLSAGALTNHRYLLSHHLWSPDSNQKLFRPCGCEKADVICQEPVLNVFGNTSCPLHVSLPVLPHYSVESEEKKEEKGAGDVKTENNMDVTLEENNVPILKEDVSSVGPGGDADQTQILANNVNKIIPENSVSAAVQEKPSTNDTVMDDIMADVDVVEEIVSQNENEPSSQPVETLSATENVGDNSKDNSNKDSDGNSCNLSVLPKDTVANVT